LIDRAAIGAAGDYYLCNLPQKRQAAAMDWPSGWPRPDECEACFVFSIRHNLEARKHLSHDPHAFEGMIWLEAAPR
jgi:hypothetical protein